MAGIVFALVSGMVVANAQDRPPASLGASALPISADFPFESRYLEVLGARMHYIEEGEGDPILFLHGNPTSSYLWRNIIPHVSDDARAIAVDLIGMVRSRMPVWKWPNEIPISGEPADVHEIIASYQEWLESSSVPKLLLHATPGQLIQAADVERLKQDLLNLEAVHIGQGLHFVQEDSPHAIGERCPIGIEG